MCGLRIIYRAVCFLKVENCENKLTSTEKSDYFRKVKKILSVAKIIRNT